MLRFWQRRQLCRQPFPASWRQLLTANRIYEALDLLLLAGDGKGIRGVATGALTEGVPALLLMLKRAGRNPARKEWMEEGEAAFGAGRWRGAFRCILEAGDEAALARVRERLRRQAHVPRCRTASSNPTAS